jgi:hypothetical protein
MRDQSARAMRKIANWIFGLLASMIVGGLVGAWLLNNWLGGCVWGVVAGAFTFACFRPWASNPNSEGDPKAPGEGPKISWQGADRSLAKKGPTSLPMVAGQRLMATRLPQKSPLHRNSSSSRTMRKRPTQSNRRRSVTRRPEGRARAERLASYLPSTFGAPAFIFCSDIFKHSARPYQTVELLSKAVDVPIGVTIADRDYEVLAHDFPPRATSALWQHR